MKYKLIKMDKNDRVSFSKEELETLLDEVYEEGKKDGYNLLFYPCSAPTVSTIDCDPNQLDWDNVFTLEEE